MTKKEGMVNWWVSINIVTGSIARSAKRRYLSNSEADFRFFSPQGRHVAPMGGEIINWLQKTATKNGNLQPEVETNEYSSSKKNCSSSLLLQWVVYYSSSTWVLTATIRRFWTQIRTKLNLTLILA